MAGKSLKNLLKMRHDVTDIIEYNGEWYLCVDNDNCQECSLINTECYGGIKSDIAERVFGVCGKVRRSDNTNVIFKKLEKVGEPMMIHDKLVQKVKNPNALGCLNCHFCHNATCELTLEEAEFYDCGEGTIYIEIKQNQEDMKEKKLNLKEFDLEAAKAGKPICTRDGRKARIICFDRDWDMHIVALVSDPLGESVHYYLSNGKVDFDKQNDEDLMMLPEKLSNLEHTGKNLKPFDLEEAKLGRLICTRNGRKARIALFDLKDKNYPIAAAVLDSDGDESIRTYTTEGIYDKGEISGLDLMMLPEKHEGWINLYKSHNDKYVALTSNICKTREIAEANADLDDYLTTLKVEWED